MLIVVRPHRTLIPWLLLHYVKLQSSDTQKDRTTSSQKERQQAHEQSGSSAKQLCDSYTWTQLCSQNSLCLTTGITATPSSLLLIILKPILLHGILICFIHESIWKGISQCRKSCLEWDMKGIWDGYIMVYIWNVSPVSLWYHLSPSGRSYELNCAHRCACTNENSSCTFAYCFVNDSKHFITSAL